MQGPVAGVRTGGSTLCDLESRGEILCRQPDLGVKRITHRLLRCYLPLRLVSCPMFSAGPVSPLDYPALGFLKAPQFPRAVQ